MPVCNCESVIPFSLAIMPCSYVGTVGTVGILPYLVNYKWTWERPLRNERNYAHRLVRNRARPSTALSGAHARRSAALLRLGRAIPGASTSSHHPTPRESSAHAPVLRRRNGHRTSALVSPGSRGVAALRAELPLLPRNDVVLHIELFPLLPNFTPSRCTHGRTNDTMAGSSL